MKPLKLITIGLVIFLSSTVNAQVSVNINIVTPPLWGPVGYTEVQYYYLPDVEAYYDIPSGMFIFFDGGIWIHSAYLPHRYRHYDLYNGYKVVLVDYHGDSPYHNHKFYKNKYKKGYRGVAQKTNGAHPGKGNSNMNKPAKNSGNNHKQGQGNTPNNKQNAQPKNNHNKGNGGGKGKNH
ncbi:MAG: hypothetical protein A3K10_03540 [Bacteroidetes bacterium RIFCSPLOWO2_12_FULL_31_6]|nr:MAG: hypothetical protein A3K10_03540 [Bacteroidetes bacterium RIFCSPLOWO2_12_FULL_31_6]